jgi:hypothetical protein
MLLQCFIIVISGDTLYHDGKDDSVRIMCVSLVSVSMNCWCLLEPSSALKVIVWGNLVWENANFEECFCDILAQGLIGLIGYSYQQVATSFLGTHSKGTLG